MAACIAIVAGGGCTNPKNAEEKSSLIQAGSVTISRADFSRELSIKQANYPYDIKKSSNEYNAMVLDLVSDLADEAVLLAAAAAKGIDVSAKELAHAVADFKKDYPEDSFDRMLLERAISYPVWENRLRKDLVISKLIMQDLVANQEIRPEEMIAFYDRVAEQTGTQEDQDKDKDKDKSRAQDNNSSNVMDEKDLVLRLRMEKSQEVFGPWLQGLQDSYPVHIDRQALSAFLVNNEKSNTEN